MSQRPLYKTSQGPEAQRSADGHGGLWYDKFCVWKVENGWSDPQFEPLAWVKAAVLKPAGNEKLLAEYVARRQRMLSALGGQAICVKTAGRFVTGLGYRHPVENGFAWHPVLGTPYLPGSGVKGVARAWAELQKAPRSTVHRIFGPRSGDGEQPVEHARGSVVFLEAIPRKPVELVAEVMTPHYGPYYQNGEAPGDYHDPTPIPFLAVKEGTSFLSGVLPGSGQAADDVRQAHVWLLEALEWIGAGAKTATGYGRFSRDEEAEQAWEKQATQKRQAEQEAQRRDAGPLERMRLLVEQLSEGRLYELVVRNLEKGELKAPAEQEAFRRAVQDSPFYSSWRKGQALDPKECRAGGKKLKQIAKLITGSE